MSWRGAGTGLHHRAVRGDVRVSAHPLRSGGLLGIEIPLVHYIGHLWATLLSYGRVGALIEMLADYALVVTGIVLIAKGWARVHSSGGRLVQDGVYSMVRHPQYTGIFLAVFGQLVHWPTIPT